MKLQFCLIALTLVILESTVQSKLIDQQIRKNFIDLNEEQQSSESQIDQFRYLQDDHAGHDHSAHASESTTKEDAWPIVDAPWFWAVMAEVVIGVSGFICAVIIGPSFKDANGNFKPSMLKFLNILLMFASGCLYGDALLHLIPHAFENIALLQDNPAGEAGAETPGHEGHGHRLLQEDDHSSHDHSGGLKIGLAVTAGYFAYMIFENIAKAMGVTHSHGGESHSHNKVKDKTVNIPSMNDQGSTTGSDSGELRMKGAKSDAAMVLFSDLMENIIDGIALGVVFNTNKDLAMSTFIAVWAHELPAQMGNLGILINSGFSAKKAVALNVIMNCTAFIGVLIGLIIGELNKVFTVYVTLIIAGNFLYISLTLMIPKAREIKDNMTLWCGLVGYLLGIAVMIGITFIE